MDDILEEVILVGLIGVFSTMFYHGVHRPALHLAFLVASLGFLYTDRSQHFTIATLAFATSLFIVEYGFVQVIASIGVVFFALGFHHHVFGRIE